MRTSTTLSALLAACLVVPGAALASHMGAYATNPVEHDDQGRSHEPDCGATAVLGPLVVGDNAAFDPFPCGVAPPGHSRWIAPGCMGEGAVPAEGHTRLSGQCGLWTVGAGTPQAGNVVPPGTVPEPVSETGRCNAAPPEPPPGRLSGFFCPGFVVTFLDSVVDASAHTAGVYTVNVNRKLYDAAKAAGLAPPDELVAGPTSIWAWYGRWQDKNGNGVIDTFADMNPAGPGCAAPPCDGDPVAAAEEFQWLGNCRKFPGVFNPNAVASGYCALAPTDMPGWFFPGNHHAYCGGTADPVFLTCPLFPADIPGRQLIHYVGYVTSPLHVGCAGPSPVGFFCDVTKPTFDDTDEDLFGDPLLGPQGSVEADQTFDDRTGDPALSTRQWAYGLGWATWFYDQSLVVSLVHVAGAGCAPGGPNEYDLPTCSLVDVDHYQSVNPALENLVQNTVKPTARGAWVLLRAALP